MVLIITSFNHNLLDDDDYEEDSIEMKKNDELFEKFSAPIFYGDNKNQFLV